MSRPKDIAGILLRQFANPADSRRTLEEKSPGVHGKGLDTV